MSKVNKIILVTINVFWKLKVETFVIVTRVYRSSRRVGTVIKCNLWYFTLSNVIIIRNHQNAIFSYICFMKHIKFSWINNKWMSQLANQSDSKLQHLLLFRTVHQNIKEFVVSINLNYYQLSMSYCCYLGIYKVVKILLSVIGIKTLKKYIKKGKR